MKKTTANPNFKMLSSQELRHIKGGNVLGVCSGTCTTNSQCLKGGTACGCHRPLLDDGTHATGRCLIL